ncbi:MAG: twin-arginine translocase TatA/TatE family subunit [Solirubrobacteraceae bacterium]|jgi:sec-independent protein translocase protein TatA
MLGLDNPIHLLFLLAILLLVFGAKRLPEIGSSLGAGLRGFKESISGEGHQPRAEQAPAATLMAANAPVATPVGDAAPESTQVRTAA